jgi:hypothetical protein
MPATAELAESFGGVISNTRTAKGTTSLGFGIQNVCLVPGSFCAGPTGQVIWNGDAAIGRAGAGYLRSVDPTGKVTEDFGVRNLTISATAPNDGLLGPSMCTMFQSSDGKFTIRCRGSDGVIRHVDLTTTP